MAANNKSFIGEYGTSLGFSVTFHIVVAAVFIVGFPALKRDFNPLPNIIPVDFVRIDDVTRAISKEPAVVAVVPEEEPAQEEPRQSMEALVPDAVPTLESAKSDNKIEDVAEEKRAPSPLVAPRMKPKPPSALDTSRIAALIDKSKEKQAVNTPAPQDNSKKIADAVERMQMNQMEVRQATITIQSLIRSKVEQCWSVPAGAKGADDLMVRIKIYLRPDGTLARVPEYMDSARLVEPFYRTAAESAVRAIRRCAPYDLPQEQYQLWRELIFTFDPKELLEGS